MGERIPALLICLGVMLLGGCEICFAGQAQKLLVRDIGGLQSDDQDTL